MKKLFALFVIAAVVMGAAVAQSQSADPTAEGVNSYADTSTIFKEIEDKYADFHPTASTVKLELEYTPLTGDVVVYYTCLSASYDQGEAMNTVDAVLEDFQIENKFTRRPTFTKKDRTRYFKDGREMRMATYRRSVKYDR